MGPDPGRSVGKKQGWDRRTFERNEKLGKEMMSGKRPRYTSGLLQKALLRRKTLEHFNAAWVWITKRKPWPSLFLRHPLLPLGMILWCRNTTPLLKSPTTRQVVRKHNFASPSLGLTFCNPRSDWALPRPGASHQVSMCDSECLHWRLASHCCSPNWFHYHFISRVSNDIPEHACDMEDGFQPEVSSLYSLAQTYCLLYLILCPAIKSQARSQICIVRCGNHVSQGAI